MLTTMTIQNGDPTKIFTTKIQYFLFFCFLFIYFRAAPVAYGSSQARGVIGAAAAGLRQSHSNARSQLCLRPTPQLTAMLDPLTH